MTDQPTAEEAKGVTALHEPTRLLLDLEREWQPPTTPRLERVPVDLLEVVPALFQPRDMSEKHIEDLKRAIKSIGDLDAMLVLPVGSRLIIVDGHHRLEAYQRAGTTVAVPISYFEGSPREALFEAGKQNSKAKLPMESRERQDYAWRLVLFDNSSKAEVSGASGVSTSQVANMRKVRSQLGDDAFDYASWFKARAAAKGSSKSTADDIDQWKQELAGRWADGMAKQFSTRMANHPEVAAMALDMYFGRKLPELFSELRSFMAD
ncbi:MAG: ParB/RepB/Spo0J family partition protein, partial [Pseudomonas sp.]